MNEEPKSIWKKALRHSKLFGAWLFLMAATMLVFLIILLIIGEPFKNLSDLVKTLMASLVVATVAFCLWLSVRWVCCWRNFKRFLFGFACSVTLIGLFYAEEDWRGKHDWERFKQKWEAKGEKFSYAEIIPPPVPDNQNFAMAPIWVESMKAVLGPKNSRRWFGTNNYAENGRTNFVDRLDLTLTKRNSNRPRAGYGNWQTATLTDLKPWQNYYRTLAAITNLFPVAAEPQTPAQDVLLALSKYDSTIEALRQASQRLYSRFPIYSDPEHPFNTLLPHLSDLKRSAQVLQLRAIAELQNGQSDKALADIKLMLYLAAAVRTEPILISHLVRIAIVQITLQPIYEGLAKHKWSNAQLAGMDSELAKLDFLADYELAMRGERSCQIGVVESMRRENFRRFSEVIGNGDGASQLTVAASLYDLCPSGWLYQNELCVSQFYEQWYLPLANVKKGTVFPAAVRAADKAYRAEFLHGNPENFLVPWLLPDFRSVVERFAHAQTSVNLARVAIALERYRLAHGNYPDSLDVLTPQFMEKMPHDIIGGQPLHYRLMSNGQFVLYSIGWDETDDGGVVVYKRGSKPPRVDISKGDWVWRYPSK